MTAGTVQTTVFWVLILYDNILHQHAVSAWGLQGQIQDIHK